MAQRSVRVGLVQYACGEDVEANVACASALVRQAASKGAQIVLLPELFASVYFCQTLDERRFALAQPASGPLITRMRALSRELGITLLAGFFEQEAPGLYYNSLALCGANGELLGVYRKMHIPHDPQFEEKYYFAPGDRGFMAVRAGDAVLGPLICWDQWYPEAARLTALLGAELLFYPTAIGWLPDEKAEFGADQLSAWQTIQRSHAIANGVFTVSANRIGVESSERGEIEFWGHSFICDPQGRILAQAGQEQAVLLADCDLGLIGETRRTWPFLRDRRVDEYGALTRRFGRDGT